MSVRAFQVTARISCLLLLGLSLGTAQEASLKVSTQTPTVGKPFLIQVEIVGGSGRMRMDMDIPGLDLRGAGTSFQSIYSNGQSTTVNSKSFHAVAHEEGELVIPELEIKIGNKTLKTKPVTLDVQKSSGRQPLQPKLGPGVPVPQPQRPQPQTQQQQFPDINDDATVFMRIEPEREELYVGETVEVKIKLYVDARVPVINFSRELSLKGEDGVFQPTVGPDFQIKRSRRGGRYYAFNQERLGENTYNVLTYRTTLTTVKPGEVTMDPVEVIAVVQLPRQHRVRRRSPFDSILGFDDPFFDDVFGQRKHELRRKSEPLTLKVLPLPEEGRPDHFDGAIGRFSLKVSADKNALEVDEALTLSAKVTGHGNFERINRVAVEEGDDWKGYPPKIEFTAEELGLSGEKTFEQTFIAKGPTNSVPQIQFCYFDPQTKRYVNLTGDDLSISVTGVAKALASAPESAGVEENPANTSAITPLTASSPTSFFQGRLTPLIGSSGFLAANGFAAASALALLFWRARSGERRPKPHQRLKQWRRERDSAWNRLELATEPAEIRKQIMLWLGNHARIQEAFPNGNEAVGEETLAREFVRKLAEDSESKQPLLDFLAFADALRWSSNTAASIQVAQNKTAWTKALQSLEESTSA